MSLQLTDLIWIALLGGAIGYFLAGHRARDLAYNAATQACRREGLQLLDGSVSLRRISLSRDDGQRWRVWRQYHFEYSQDGVDRLQGSVIMLGDRVHGLVIAHGGSEGPVH